MLINRYFFLFLLTPVLLLAFQSSFAQTAISFNPDTASDSQKQVLTSQLYKTKATAPVRLNEMRKNADIIPFSVSKYYDWTGTYAGIHLGGGFGTSRRDFIQGISTGNFGINSIIGGITLGHNMQFGNIVTGLESDFSINSLTGNANQPNPYHVYKTGNPWLATFRPRLGYAFGNVVPYVTGGLAIGNVHVSSYSNTGAFGSDFTRTELGWTVGTGIEAIIMPNCSLKAEYLYAQLNNAEGTNIFTGTQSSTSFNEHIWRVGLNYNFNHPHFSQTNQASSPLYLSKSINLASQTGIELGGQISNYRYQEGPNIMHETGIKGGITATATKSLDSGFFVAADTRFAFSANDYSSPHSGTKSGIPDFLGEIRLFGGKDFVFDKFALSPYAGLAYRNLYNDSRGVFSSGANGYRRDSQYFYMPIGITARFRITEASRISTNLEYDQLIEGWQKSYLSDANSILPNPSNGQYGGYGLRGSTMYERSSWSIGPFFNYWNINQSATNCGLVFGVFPFCGVEPHNQTIEYGLQARYRF